MAVVGERRCEWYTLEAQVKRYEYNIFLMQLLEAAVTDMPTPTRYLLTLPKFGVRVHRKLTEYLKTLGLFSLFDILTADLLPMMQHPVPGHLYVSTVLHEALVQVIHENERGWKGRAFVYLSFLTSNILLILLSS